MSRLCERAALAACLSAGVAGSASAQLAVYDASAVAQLIEQVETQLEQLTTLRAQLESITGFRGVGGILNSVADQEARGAAMELTAIVDGAISGAPVGGNTARIDARLDELRGTFELDVLSGFLDSDIPQDRALATLGGSGMAAMATADDSYGRANAAMQRASGLIEGIDANPDLKASVDYNTRMLAEILVVLNESLRLQAAMANSLGSEALHQARDGVATREFMRVGED